MSDLQYTEICRQEYSGNNCVISSGFVEGEDKHECDTVYLGLDKEGEEPITILMTLDELQAIAWVAAGTVWCHLYDKRE